MRGVAETTGLAEILGKAPSIDDEVEVLGASVSRMLLGRLTGAQTAVSVLLRTDAAELNASRLPLGLAGTPAGMPVPPSRVR